MSLAFLHTTDQHIRIFSDMVAASFGPRAVQHHVESNLLTDLQDGRETEVLERTQQVLQGLKDKDHIICTCSSLGPIVDRCAETLPKVMRVDRPMMQQACQYGPHVMLVASLQTALGPAQALLAECAEQAGCSIKAHPLVCHGALDIFLSGDVQRYIRIIVEHVQNAVAGDSPPDCIVLTQVSMLPAMEPLQNLGLPVLTSPELAIKHIAYLER